MQGGQRGAQVVRDVGDQVAPLLVLPGQFAPLVRYALAHLHEAAPQHRDFVAIAVRGVAGALQRGQGLPIVAVEGTHGPRQAAQRARDQRKGRQPRHQPQQRYQRDGPQGRAQDGTARHRHRQRVMRLSLQNHIHVALFLPAHAYRRRAEHLLRVQAARIVARDRQHLARQQTLDGPQVDAIPLDLARRRGVAHDAAVVRQQVDLHRRVHGHQHVKQRTHRIGLPALGVHQFVGAGDMLGQPAGQTLDHFLLVAGIGGDLQPGRSAAAGQQQQGEHGRQPLGKREPLHDAPPGAPGVAANL